MSSWEQRQTPAGERYLVCLPLERAGLRHAFTLKPAGPPGQDRSPRALPAGILKEIGLGSTPVTTTSQVHGKTVAVAAADGSAVPREADAVVLTGGAGAIATADCVGAIVYAPRSRAAAVVHAGWRGTLAGVLPAAIERLSSIAGESSSTFLLAMGPSIGGCCYEVGDEVVVPFRKAFDDPGKASSVFGARSGRITIDLVSANAVQAERSGLEPHRIHAARICTSCSRDLCWSYRSEGKGAGRMWTISALP